MGASTCVACGECVQACPTGALMPARDVALAVPDKQVQSLCPYCGVGCQLTYNVKDNKILYVNGRDGPANHGRLCVKGRYGFDYAHHPQRLRVPLIRRADAPKRADATMDPERVLDVFREATWEEALELAGGRLARAARRARPEGARRLRLGQGQQRRGLPVPEARAHGLSQQQRRPLHAPVPRVERRRAARGHRLGGGLEPGDGRRQGRGRHHHRRQPEREPSGGVELDQERGAQRHQADRLRPAPLRAGAPRAPLPAVQARHRRRAAQRDDARHRRGGPRRRGVHRQPHDRLRRAARQRRRLQPGGDGADLRHRRRDDPLRRAPVRDLARVDDPLGHGHLAARARHRQRALPDRALADDGPDRPPRHGAASAARPEQRPGRVRRGPDPDDVPRLPARLERRPCARASRAPGAWPRARSTSARA